jgi:glycosyltransferase involved in cell wall biosynthesis
LRVSVITPSFNQGAFIQRTVDSVVSQQGDFELEYLVVDGGSTDETLSILRRHQGRLRFISEKDSGQPDAINKGFRMTSGDVVAWLNSDDTYQPGALDTVVRTLRETGARWCFGECKVIDAQDREIHRAISLYKRWVSGRYSLRRLLGRNFISQPATFFSRKLLEEAGPIDPALHLAMDYDLWLRFARLAEPVFVAQPLANFRRHDESKSGARYRAMAWECFNIARARARGLERVALAEHLIHLAAELAVYRLLDLKAALLPEPSSD